MADRPPTPLAVMDDPGFYPDTLTRGQLDHLRGGLSNGNGAGDLLRDHHSDTGRAVEVERPEPKSQWVAGPQSIAPASRTCAQCGGSMEGKKPEAVVCGPECRSARHALQKRERARAVAADRSAPEDTLPVRDDNPPAEIFRTPTTVVAAPLAGLLELLDAMERVVSLTGALPPGWDAHLGAGEAYLQFHSPA